MIPDKIGLFIFTGLRFRYVWILEQAFVFAMSGYLDKPQFSLCLDIRHSEISRHILQQASGFARSGYLSRLSFSLCLDTWTSLRFRYVWISDIAKYPDTYFSRPLVLLCLNTSTELSLCYVWKVEQASVFVMSGYMSWPPFSLSLF